MMAAGPLLVASQTDLAFFLEGHLGRTICIWMQQCAGTRLQYNSLGKYIVGDDDYFLANYADVLTDMPLDENILSKDEYAKALKGKRHFKDESV